MQDEFDLYNLPTPRPKPTTIPKPIPKVRPKPKLEVDTCPIWLGHLEIIYKKYLA